MKRDARENTAERRIRKELQDVQSLTKAGISIHSVGKDYLKWKVYIQGPDDTPYAGGTFMLSISIPQNYPFSPPKFKFETKIWHPNISSQTGAICLDILKDEWTPIYSIRTALLSIQLMLSVPEPDSPQDAEVANMYKRDLAEFKSTAIAWTKTFARKLDETEEEKLKKIIEMGFTEQDAMESLVSANWDETVALNFLVDKAPSGEKVPR